MVNEASGRAKCLLKHHKSTHKFGLWRLKRSLRGKRPVSSNRNAKCPPKTVSLSVRFRLRTPNGLNGGSVRRSAFQDEARFRIGFHLGDSPRCLRVGIEAPPFGEILPSDSAWQKFYSTAQSRDFHQRDTMGSQHATASRDKAIATAPALPTHSAHAFDPTLHTCIF